MDALRPDALNAYSRPDVDATSDAPLLRESGVDGPNAVDVLYPPTSAPVLLLRYTNADPVVIER